MKFLQRFERTLNTLNKEQFKITVQQQLFKKQYKPQTSWCNNVVKGYTSRYCFSTVDNIKKYSDIPSNLKYYEQSEQVKVNDLKELLLSGGGSAISFQAGYMHALSEFIPKKILKQYRVGGVSSGSCIASFFVCSIYSEKDMKYWYEKYLRESLRKIHSETFGFFNATKYVKEQASLAYLEAQDLNVPFNGTLHLYISSRKYIIGITKTLIDHFKDSQQFGEAISCSCSIPFVTTGKFSDLYQGSPAIDGGLTMALPFRNKDSDCIFLNVLPEFCSEFPVVRERPDFLSVIQTAEGQSFTFPGSYFTWDPQIADQYFVKGYIQAHKQQQKLLRAFKMI